MNKLLQIATQIQNNPEQLGQMLYQSGKISQEQFSAIQGKTPSEIGNYLINNNILPQEQLNKLKQQAQMFKGLLK